MGRCRFDAAVLLPTSTYFGMAKEGSYIYGTWRDADGNLLRALRGVGADRSDICFIFASGPGSQLARELDAEASVWRGATSIVADGQIVTFRGGDPGLEFVHEPERCRWVDGEAVRVTGTLLGPAMQWFNSWDGGSCYSVSAKYRSSGTLLGRPVEGFIGHEIHYFSAAASWFASPFAAGREICWQQIANEYADGSTIQATFAYGTDGWGFALLQDEIGTFHQSTDVVAEATVLDNGYPETVNYRFAGQSWTWRIDPRGQRPPILPGSPLLGADGTCTRDGDERPVRLSMGNSDWWTDGRADPILRS